MADKPLSDQVREKLEQQCAGERLFEPEILDAMRLSDEFESVKPQDYVLPLDAMAGFPVSLSKSK